ncbi:MAG TPA: M48 family metallopeptidase [Elusimicrobiota bacterium]|nr:M48 family metallopeptidase [Elusimicrobiota bacterium]
MPKAIVAALVCAALLPGPLRAGFDESRMDARIKTLQQNVDQAFLWNYLGGNKNAVQTAPARLTNISLKVLRATGKAMSYRLHLYVVDSDVTNAATSPGGNIFVYRGILDLGLTDDQVAALFAHEIAHVMKRHWLTRLKRGVEAARLAQYAAKTYGKGSAELTYLYQTIQNLAYNRAEENEADATGLQLLANAGYPPMAMAELLEKVQARQAQDPAAAKTAAYLSSHPMIPERVARIRALAASGRLKPQKKRLF